jgi:hypothetical protein
MCLYQAQHVCILAKAVRQPGLPFSIVMTPSKGSMPCGIQSPTVSSELMLAARGRLERA